MAEIKQLCLVMVWLGIAAIIYREARASGMNYKTWTLAWLIFPPTLLAFIIVYWRRTPAIPSPFHPSGNDMMVSAREPVQSVNSFHTGIRPLQARSTLSQAGIFVLVNAGIVATLAVVFPSGALFAPVIGISGAVVSLLLSKWLAKRAHNTYIIDPRNFRSEEEKWLYTTVADLSQKAGLPGMPEVGVYDSPDMNAFATGPRKDSALVAFSTGLLQKCDHAAITGIAAHEIAHVANGDMILLTLVQAVVNTLILLITMPLSALRLVALFSDRVDWFIFFLISLLRYAATITLTFLGSLVLFWFSRRREFAADYGAATLAGAGAMIHALSTLGQDPDETPATQSSYAAFKIKSAPRWLDIFSTHPSLQQRIDRLECLRNAHSI